MAEKGWALTGTCRTYEENVGTAIPIDFNLQYKKVEEIFRRHLPVLKKDCHLSLLFTEFQNVFIGKHPLWGIWLWKMWWTFHYRLHTPLWSKRFYACGRCCACKITKGNVRWRKEFTAFFTGKTRHPRFYFLHYSDI